MFSLFVKAGTTGAFAPVSFNQINGQRKINQICRTASCGKLAELIVYIVFVFYNEARAVCALSFGLLHWLYGSGSKAEIS